MNDPLPSSSGAGRLFSSSGFDLPIFSDTLVDDKKSVEEVAMNAAVCLGRQKAAREYATTADLAFLIALSMLHAT